ncbi:MAG TPA: vWA domain-containing protein [Fredinandcohnia sp.]|nr:vWA domain-containing protein [Fredinandcohnia sp.]
MAKRIAVTAVVLALVGACQAYNMEEVDPQTIVALETEGTYVRAQPPTLLILQDRSASMRYCFEPTPTPGSGHGCRPLGGAPEDVVPDRRSRMVVARSVIEKTVRQHAQEVWFGLVAYGVGDPVCGSPEALVDPGPDSADGVIEAYYGQLMEEPEGGTPTTQALAAAYERLVDEEGKLRYPDRENYVVLVTDGLMNCNGDHEVECVCAVESGCAGVGGQLAFGEEGELIVPIQCLDDAASLKEVERLRAAGVRTFVIGLGEVFTEEQTLSTLVLDRLAEAGGVPREDHAQKFYSAADEAELEAALAAIIERIAAPCVYELDGPVCDGRLVKIALRIDGERVETQCNAELDAEADWFFVRRQDGSLDPRTITFSPPLCQRLAEADTVSISIRGVENACPDETVEPACTLAD